MCDPVTGFELLCVIAGYVGVAAGMQLTTHLRNGTPDEVFLHDRAIQTEIGNGFDTQALKLTSAFNHVRECLKQQGSSELYGKFQGFEPNHKSWARDPLNGMTVQRVAEVLDMYKRFLNPLQDDIAKTLGKSSSCMAHWHELLEGLASFTSFLEDRTRAIIFEWTKAKLIYDSGSGIGRF